MQLAKKLSLMFLTLLVTGTAMSAVQHHPFSEIFPPDTDLNFGDQNAENISRLEMSEGFVLDRFSLMDEGNNHAFRLDRDNDQFMVEGAGVNVTSGNVTSSNEMCIGKYC